MTDDFFDREGGTDMIDQNLLEKVADRLEKLQPYSPDTLAIDLERIRLQALADQAGVEIDPWRYTNDEIREHLIRQRRRDNLRKARYLLTGAWGPEKDSGSTIVRPCKSTSTI